MFWLLDYLFEKGVAMKSSLIGRRGMRWCDSGWWRARTVFTPLVDTVEGRVLMSSLGEPARVIVGVNFVSGVGVRYQGGILQLAAGLKKE